MSGLNLWKFLIPLFGVFFSWLLIPEEQPQPLTAAGMIIISLALLASNLVQRKKGPIIQEKA